MAERQFRLDLIVSAETDKASAQLKSLGGAFGNLQTATVAAFAAIGVAGIAAGVVVGKFLADAVDLGADAVESIGKFEVVFGDFAAESRAELDRFAGAVGRSRFELVEMAGGIQNVLVPLGFQREEAAALSVTMSELAVDVASFNNAQDADVLRAFQSAVVGNTEAVRSLGIVITAASVDAELLALGIEGGASAATEQEKALARLNLIMAATTDAQGDATRTADSWSNQSRALTARLTDMKTEIGLALIPVLTPFLEIIRKLADRFLPDLVAVFENNVIPAIDAVATMATVFFDALESGMTPLGALQTVLAGAFGADVASAVGDWIDKVKEFFDAVMVVLDPIIQWVSENVSLNDILIALGIVLATIVVPILVTVGQFILPIIGLFVAMVAVVALLRAAWENDFLGIRTALIEAWENVILPALAALQEWLGTNIPVAVAAMAALASAAFERVKTAVATLAGFWTEKLKPAIDIVISLIQEKVMPVLAALVGAGILVVQGALQILAGIWTGILLPAIQAVWGFIQDSIIPLFASLVELGIVVMQLAIEVLSDVWTGTLAPALETVVGIFNDRIKPAIDDVVDVVGNFLGPILETVATGAIATFKAGLDGIAGIIDGITSAIRFVIDALGDLSNAPQPNISFPGFAGAGFAGASFAGAGGSPSGGGRAGGNTSNTWNINQLTIVTSESATSAIRTLDIARAQQGTP